MISNDHVVTMPSFGGTTTEGTVARWHCRAGDRVAAGQPIAEIVTDKVSEELLAPVDGILGAVLVPSGHVAPVGTPLVAISVSSSAPPSPMTSATGEGSKSPTSGDAGEASHYAARTSPLVRRIADEHGIDLTTVVGTGPGGRVTKDDIVAAVASKPPAPRSDVAPDTEELPASPLRQTIASNLVRAVTGVPQAWTLVEVDASALLAWRDAHRESVHARTGLTLSAFAAFVHVASRVVAAHPLLNASWHEGPGGVGAIGEAGGRVVVHRTVNAGIAVARPSGGLLVPVIRDAPGLALDALAVALDNAVRGAREGTLSADRYSGATVTLNNTGALGSVVSQPILPPKTSAIVAFEAIVKRPVVVAGDAIAIRPMVNICLTFDHRVLDGLEACNFLSDVKRSLETLDT